MTTTPDTQNQPVELIEWLYEDALIIQACEDHRDQNEDVDEDLSMDHDLQRIVREQVRTYRTPDNLAETIERELDLLTKTVGEKLPEGRIQEAARKLQTPGDHDSTTVPHHPTTETVLHWLLSQHAAPLEGNRWAPEHTAREIAPDVFQTVREVTRKFEPGQHLLDEMDRELAYLSNQALEMLEEIRKPSQPEPCLQKQAGNR